MSVEIDVWKIKRLQGKLKENSEFEITNCTPTLPHLTGCPTKHKPEADLECERGKKKKKKRTKLEDELNRSHEEVNEIKK